MKIETVGDIAAGLTPLVEAMEVTSHPDTVQDAITSALAEFGPEGKWRYAPEQERVKVRQQVAEEQATKAGEAVYALEQEATVASQWLAGLEAEQQQPIDPVTAWQRARKTSAALPPLEVQNLSILAELQVARFERTLGEARPSAITAAYQKALTRPLEQDSVNLIRWVEEKHGAGWSGRDVEGSVEEAMATQTLSAAIREVRLARISADVQAARAVIAQALASAERVKGTRRIRAQRPALWRVA